jgi:hypothetical protein
MKGNSLKIKLKYDVGVIEGYVGACRGDVIEVNDAQGIRYCRLGYADPVTKSAEKNVEREEHKIEKAVADEGYETTALQAQVNTEPGTSLEDAKTHLENQGQQDDDDKPKPLDDPKPSPSAAKRTGSRR